MLHGFHKKKSIYDVWLNLTYLYQHRKTICWRNRRTHFLLVQQLFVISQKLVQHSFIWWKKRVWENILQEIFRVKRQACVIFSTPSICKSIEQLRNKNSASWINFKKCCLIKKTMRWPVVIHTFYENEVQNCLLRFHSTI